MTCKLLTASGNLDDQGSIPEMYTKEEILRRAKIAVSPNYVNPDWLRMYCAGIKITTHVYSQGILNVFYLGRYVGYIQNPRLVEN